LFKVLGKRFIGYQFFVQTINKQSSYKTDVTDEAVTNDSDVWNRFPRGFRPLADFQEVSGLLYR